jgi:hypothetical protein
MRRAAPWLALAVLLGIVFVSSCDDDDPMAMPVTVELRHDGDNAQAPNLGAATYEAAARFSAAATAPLAGGELTAVMFHVTSLPSSAAVKIYGPGTASTPGALLYSADVGAALVPASWNTHTLTNPVTVIGGDLWISIEFTHVATQKMIGCPRRDHAVIVGRVPRSATSGSLSPELPLLSVPSGGRESGGVAGRTPGHRRPI